MKVKKEKQVDIMGKPWTIRWLDDEKKGVLGDCEDSTRSIHIYLHYSESRGNPRRCEALTLRHELLHAYMYECGLGEDVQYTDNGHDETMVDGFARICMRYWKTCKELGAWYE